MPPVPHHLLDLYPPDRHALFALACESVTDEALVMISKLDYGQDAAEHLAKLREIRSTGVVPAHLAWEPREVLELCRHLRPDSRSFLGNPSNPYTPWSSKDAESLRNGHFASAFSCAVLLEHGQDHPDHHIGEESTYTSATRSCIALGRAYQQAFACFLTHDLLNLQVDWVSPYWPARSLALTSLAQLFDTHPVKPADELRVAINDFLTSNDTFLKSDLSRTIMFESMPTLDPTIATLHQLDDPPTTQLLNAIDELLEHAPEEPDV